MYVRRVTPPPRRRHAAATHPPRRTPAHAANSGIRVMFICNRSTLATLPGTHVNKLRLIHINGGLTSLVRRVF